MQRIVPLTMMEILLHSASASSSMCCARQRVSQPRPHTDGTRRYRCQHDASVRFAARFADEVPDQATRRRVDAGRRLRQPRQLAKRTATRDDNASNDLVEQDHAPVPHQRNRRRQLPPIAAGILARHASAIQGSKPDRVRPLTVPAGRFANSPRPTLWISSGTISSRSEFGTPMMRPYAHRWSNAFRPDIRASSCGPYDRLERARLVCSAQLSPATNTSPSVGRSSPVMHRMVVVLPAPFVPRCPKHSPARTEKLIESTYRREP